MKKKTYEVIFEQTETFKVIVKAFNQQKADGLATKKFGNGDYTEMGDCRVTNISVKEIKS